LATPRGLPAAAELVIEALTGNGFVVHVDARTDTFARLLVFRPDIDAVLASGRYTGDQLLHLIEVADPGFDRATFADVLGPADQISDVVFAPMA
jgi:hypothetical protein